MSKEYYFVYFEPEEWIAFREVKQFGSGSYAQTVYPSPYPFYGAVRSAILKAHGIELQYHKKPNIPKQLQELVGDENNPGRIKLIGPFIYSEENGQKKHYFPAPKNVYLKQDNGEKQYKRMQYFEIETKVGNFTLKGLAWIPEMTNIEPVEEAYIELRELEKYKQGQSFKLSSPKNFIIESKVGIALEKDYKKVKESMLYTMNVYRFKNGGFFMITDSEETVQELTKLEGVFLGAKQRWARISVEKVTTTLFDKLENTNHEQTAIMLITPAIYDEGIAPYDLKFGNSQILAIASGKRMVISGWDYAFGRPKPIYHAVASGTVYYLDSIPSETEVITKSKHNLFGFGSFIYTTYEKFKANI
ncbi:hypothetical protein IM42_00485 [Fervidobacterium sp. SC_NGM5_O18]|uniref:Type III-B CRISPR module-associated protein Cmr3 n=1 Tax=Fervidobacterium pennivorans TaxID=93466 RepID=A0A172T138_FERPE|nr:type III-B CRISPR module-associated protein Cmr3 [Fervidobacterium pennivorans]ANE40717.1 hypothetical protein JM64_00765 [Fervidobacterium pennivorans]PHJ13405.1 hypothetical protein IM42_00485 [Fervidobacterium sp. SC_NGM5_O18]